MKKRIALVVLITLSSIGAGIAVAFLVSWAGIPLCIFHAVTGLDCPGCGTTRAVLALFRLELAEAWGYNPFFFLILPYLVYVFLSVAVPYVRTGRKQLMPKPEWLNVAVLVLAVGWGILRNLPL